MKRHSRLASFAVMSVAALACSVPSPAAAAVFTVNGQSYDIFAIPMTYDNDSGAFKTPLFGGTMPWWGDPILAAQFAEEVFNNLVVESEPGYGPIFAYELDVTLTQVLGSVADLSAVGASEYRSYGKSTAWTFAVAAAPVPGPLPLFGAAAAFGWSRRLRRRSASR